jgi:tetratricopeptide (TPR) repeat protein
MKSIRVLKAFAALVVLAGLYQAAIAANGVPIPSGGGNDLRSMTPEQQAVAAYNTGIRHRDDALKSEAKAAKDTKESDRVKNSKKAREQYEKALTSFKQAISLNPKLPQAYNGAGFAYRKLGEFKTALDLYDRALELSPRFLDAIEYRAEAYLGLNMIDAAKDDYLNLFAMDRKQADLLMKAMKDYVAKKKADPAGVDPAALAAFEAWIAERSGVADTTRPMGLYGGSSWH